MGFDLDLGHELVLKANDNIESIPMEMQQIEGPKRDAKVVLILNSSIGYNPFE